MAIDFNRAYEVENGIVVSSDGSYIAGGIGDPTGIAAPIGTYYVRKDITQIWLKFGSLNSEWRQISASDVTALDTSESPAVLTTTQAILTQILAGETPAVSQTMIFGSGGNTTSNSYLPNEGVISNIVGVTVGLVNAKIRSMFLGNENTRTGGVEIRQRTPAGTGTWTEIYTMNLASQAYRTDLGLDISITTNAEIAIFTKVSLKSVKVLLNINGDSAA